MYFIQREELYRIICKNISRLRKEQGYTQETFADKAGISRSYYSQIEAPNLVTHVSLDMLFDIAGALNVNIKVLLEGC